MLTINIDPHSSLPMYEQIYNYIKNEIKNGTLPYRYKLPSTRSLAINLQVSRNTVDMSYSQLVSEGYIESIPKSGYYVAMVSDLMHINPHGPSVLKTSIQTKQQYRYDFSPFAIDINNFPYNIWRKLSKNCMNEYNNALFLLGDNQGDESLRYAISRYLFESRGVNCSEEQIIVGAGADYLLQLLSQLFQYVNTIRTIAMEDPTYKQAYKIFTGLHYSVLPIDLDHNGIKMQPLYESEASVVYVTPSHQYPLGIVMPIKRRMELLQWADKDPDRYIIEDDHDSEFRYKGKPIPALQGIDSSGKVIYLGTFSRAVAPAIRVGYMVLPKRLLELYKKHLYYYSSTVSRVDQNIITHFITDGYFERHLNKMRKIYKSKHDLLVQCLKLFREKVVIEGENGGLHLVLHFNSKATENEIIEIAKKKEIKLYGLNEHYIKKVDTFSSPSILLGYANVPEDTIPDGINALYEVLNSYLDPML
ncbi:MocR-like pyridoxine biosynthesis transcription factor PdxR [Anaerocolumna sp. MB42-C2]|uniref:MocR-like pyridoxine biosynthesis transcription factor PdxR n=1 Tax=Anaerocolumna sp. MB42-C2 TaxID=3070997 RepID=UPI0027DED19F|nr:PLP-dependent aminotransferase family protein [Anaerocolumna sp. MB42-C2]WMJ88383.1 PLP-dependent aminotransferase family protein [Anaerocolumna sp. MB42-C2]